MKKRLVLPICAMACAAIFVSCGPMAGLGASGIGGTATGAQTTGTSSQSSSSQGLLESLLTGMLGDLLPMNAQSIAGTWTYSSPEVRFDSENALAKAGGAVAASTLEGKLAEIYSNFGIRKGACSFTFNKDNTCSVKFGGQTISGKYTVNSSNHEISIVSNTGLIKLNGKAYLTPNNLAVLFDAKKLLSLMQTVGAMTGGSNSTLGTLSQLLNNYDGAMLGMNLSK